MRDVVDRLERFQRSCRMTRISRIAVAVAALSAPLALDMVSAAAPGFVDITWMSISNMYYEVGPLNVVTDGYITRLPIENLRSAMKQANLTSVDLWIGPSAVPVLKLVVPVLKPKAFLPVHWDGLWGAFEAGVPKLYADPAVEALLKGLGTTVIKPVQYMDKWRLDRSGVRPVANIEVKKALGFN